MSTTALDGQAHPQPRRLGLRLRRRHRDEDLRARGLPSATLTRLGHMLLWLLVLGGAGAGGASLALHSAAAEAPAVVEPQASTTPAEGFAELYVAAYLSRAGAQAEDAIAAFYPTSVNLADVTPGGVWVLRTSSVDVEEQARGYWAVTVAADVLVASDDGWRPGGVRYYSVGVAEDGQGLVATGLPAQVAAPPVGAEGPQLAVGALGRPDEHPAVEAAGRFLAAYLAGEGELDRYTAPGAKLRPVDPPPFAAVEVRRVGTAEGPTGTLVRAEAAASDEGGLVQVFEYSLQVVERDGRFEVAAVHPAPPLSAESRR